ncbi:MAG: hypothetical protein VSS52_013105 [Thiotrichaceae bacterium]|nr:hypothetical protein [Thiotrichaceae bacterium]
MIDSNPFFKFIWRINALIILFAGILVIGVLIYLSNHIFSEIFGIRNVSNVVNIESEQDGIKQKWLLGYMSKVAGTPYFMLPLELEQFYQQSYYEKGTTSIHNYLFINAISNNEQRWLMDNDQSLITKYHFLSEPNIDDKTNTIAILYQIVKQDSDGDKRLDVDDGLTISLSKPDGSAYHEILQNVERLFWQQVIDKNILLLTYRMGEDVFSMQVNLNDFSVLNKVKLLTPSPIQ